MIHLFSLHPHCCMHVASIMRRRLEYGSPHVGRRRRTERRGALTWWWRPPRERADGRADRQLSTRTEPAEKCPDYLINV